MDTARQETLVHKQAGIENANVLIVGCGAIGSVLANILVRMGAGRTGKLTLCDGDTVEDSNLNRQLFTASNVGFNKAGAVADTLRGINPDLNIDIIEAYMFPEDFAPKDYDMVIMAADSLFVQRQFWDKIQASKNQPAFMSPRMNGFELEMFFWQPGQPTPDGLYFSDTADKNYGDVGGTCTAPTLKEEKIAAISTTTNVVSAFAAQAFLHYTQGWGFPSRVKVDLRDTFAKDKAIKPEAPITT